MTWTRINSTMGAASRPRLTVHAAMSGPISLASSGNILAPSCVWSDRSCADARRYDANRFYYKELAYARVALQMIQRLTNLAALSARVPSKVPRICTRAWADRNVRRYHCHVHDLGLLPCKRTESIGARHSRCTKRDEKLHGSAGQGSAVSFGLVNMTFL
jgi:hypothetical protein